MGDKNKSLPQMCGRESDLSKVHDILGFSIAFGLQVPFHFREGFAIDLPHAREGDIIFIAHRLKMGGIGGGVETSHVDIRFPLIFFGVAENTKNEGMNVFHIVDQ